MSFYKLCVSGCSRKRETTLTLDELIEKKFPNNSGYAVTIGDLDVLIMHGENAMMSEPFPRLPPNKCLASILENSPYTGTVYWVCRDEGNLDMIEAKDPKQVLCQYKCVMNSAFTVRVIKRTL